MLTLPETDIDQLKREHGVLLRRYGTLQRRWSALALEQAREIERLQAQAMRLHAQIILRDTALAWMREDRLRLLAAIANGPPHVMPAAPVFQSQAPLDAQVQQASEEQASEEQASEDHADEGQAWFSDADSDADPDALAQSLRAADLVICQTGCISHGDFWRVEDHCKRTGKTCVLVQQPGALRIARLHPAGQIEQLALSSPGQEDAP